MPRTSLIAVSIASETSASACVTIALIDPGSPPVSASSRFSTSVASPAPSPATTVAASGRVLLGISSISPVIDRRTLVLPATVGLIALAISRCAVPSETSAVKASSSLSYWIPAIVRPTPALLAALAFLARFAIRRASRDADSARDRAIRSWRLAEAV